jgi:hypothetical protein
MRKRRNDYTDEELARALSRVDKVQEDLFAVVNVIPRTTHADKICRFANWLNVVSGDLHDELANRHYRATDE